MKMTDLEASGDQITDADIVAQLEDLVNQIASSDGPCLLCGEMIPANDEAGVSAHNMIGDDAVMHGAPLGQSICVVFKYHMHHLTDYETPAEFNAACDAQVLLDIREQSGGKLH